jgi:hypothetical protein
MTLAKCHLRYISPREFRRYLICCIFQLLLDFLSALSCLFAWFPLSIFGAPRQREN